MISQHNTGRYGDIAACVMLTSERARD